VVTITVQVANYVSASSGKLYGVQAAMGTVSTLPVIFFGYIIHMFVNVLNKVSIPILGFPLGFYMAAQGSLISYVVLCFWNASAQNKIDEEFGVAED